MFRPFAAALITMSIVCALSERAVAQDGADIPVLRAKLTASPDGDWRTPVWQEPASRGAVLPVLYLSLIGLEAYDGYSTNRGLNHGAIEGNSLMRSVASHPGALWAVKGGATFVSIYFAERLWREHHRGQAIGVMVLSNVIMAGVAASNASVIHAQK